ncbi:hypothetical protein EX30DRAFT_342371 [Ascodesmis nigricans]|uniref:Uncharacterized protein n=1 Tax=Ascodesmis nigricans TaxID=341454 RepID=A0A4S2MQJ1_9PEZI|nr:hypothetical protein EX30DRAFT_342371 [Ascodesmis nigricans]
MGFHNHTAHHLLALFSLGAPSSLLKASYDHESSYQRPRPPPPSPSDLAKLPIQHLSDRSKSSLFLFYFQNRINTIGVHKTLEETFFSGTPESEQMKIRLFGGFVHSWIHIGYGVEFDQPAIVAEGCAMAACSSAGLVEYYEAMKKKVEGLETPEKEVTIVELLEEMRGNEKLRTAARWTEGDKIKGVLDRAPEEMIEVAAKFRVKPDQETIDRRMAESINAVAYFTHAAQRTNKPVRLDFFLMHCVTSSLFLHPLLSLPFLTLHQKASLLELKVWVDLALYASRRCPSLHLTEITNYTPKSTTTSDTFATYPTTSGRAGTAQEKTVAVPRTPANPWLGVIDRAMAFNEDSHVVKTVRALVNGEKVCAPYEERGEFLVKGEMWKVMAEMCVDAAEESRESGEKEPWVRSAGFDEAWEGYGERFKYGGMKL